MPSSPTSQVQILPSSKPFSASLLNERTIKKGKKTGRGWSNFLNVSSKFKGRGKLIKTRLKLFSDFDIRSLKVGIEWRGALKNRHIFTSFIYGPNTASFYSFLNFLTNVDEIKMGYIDVVPGIWTRLTCKRSTFEVNHKNCFISSWNQNYQQHFWLETIWSPDCHSRKYFVSVTRVTQLSLWFVQ